MSDIKSVKPISFPFDSNCNFRNKHYLNDRGNCKNIRQERNWNFRQIRETMAFPTAPKLDNMAGNCTACTVRPPFSEPDQKPPSPSFFSWNRVSHVSPNLNQVSFQCRNATFRQIYHHQVAPPSTFYSVIFLVFDVFWTSL